MDECKNRGSPAPLEFVPFCCQTMLSLQSVTSDRWFAQVGDHLEELLIDHAHCEKKAAGVAT
ncbi:MAG: hypothetical protein KDA41_20810, partial [Planctomycetales bacterium]|nr:hypothetical protein [Planctomycetales bacterium]